MIYNAPVKDMMFLIEEWIGIEKLSSLPGYEHLDTEVLEFILQEAGKFCTNELLPINRQGDEIGAVFEQGEVRVPPGFKEAYQQFRENGWTGIDADPEHGGQGLPRLIQFLVDEMLCACNLSFKLYSELTHGVYHLMCSAASEELRPFICQGWSRANGRAPCALPSPTAVPIWVFLTPGHLPMKTVATRSAEPRFSSLPATMT